MTYKEYLNQLRKEVFNKYNRHMVSQEALAKEGEQATFIDKKLLDDLDSTHREWQSAYNEYWGVLSFIVKNKIDPNSEFGR